ncbi:class I SAM-dependent DNA methyltransferase [Streptosporangium sp. NPDC001559]|uniref:class I SAM-dependent DNA methyltransferase n=1 Tax=Streptosporangium sp. NPDC001559 TaxID=3366187 RepID=UPI0036E6539E
MPHVDETLSAYEGIAPRYDELNARTDTAGLVARYVEMVDRYGPGGRRLLDAGCGTGRSSVAFRERGFEVTGYDLSPAMVAAARRRPGAEGIRFLVGRLQRPPPGLTGFDAVTCVDVSMTYLTSEDQLCQAMAAARDQLTEGGVLVFDMNTVGYYRRVFGAPTVVDRGTGTWRGSRSPRPSRPTRWWSPGSTCSSGRARPGGGSRCGTCSGTTPTGRYAGRPNGPDCASSPPEGWWRPRRGNRPTRKATTGSCTWPAASAEPRRSACPALGRHGHFSTPVLMMPRTNVRWKQMKRITGTAIVIMAPAWM